jgi:hypothetical protein
MKIPTLQQSIFYSIIFVIGFLFQPNWVYENFWSKAEFYDSLPFHFPYLGFLVIYSVSQTLLALVGVRLVKKYL